MRRKFFWSFLPHLKKRVCPLTRCRDKYNEKIKKYEGGCGWFVHSLERRVLNWLNNQACFNFANGYRSLPVLYQRLLLLLLLPYSLPSLLSPSLLSPRLSLCFPKPTNARKNNTTAHTHAETGKQEKISGKFIQPPQTNLYIPKPCVVAKIARIFDKVSENFLG